MHATKQLDEIIDLSTNEDATPAVILRKVLVLSYQLNNARLRAWANAELDGYDAGVDLPEYRIVKTAARGTFSGPFGAMIKNKTLPSIILDERHQEFADTVYLRQGVAGIQSIVGSIEDGARMPWPADLVLYYQHSFIQGYALQEAWLHVPKQSFVEVLDAVRTRTLRFALKLREELGAVNDDVKAIPPATVEKTVTNNIYGGNVVIGGTSHRFNQVGTSSVGKGDTIALTAALSSLGFTVPEITELQQAAVQDQVEAAPGIGHRVTGWLAKIGTAVGTAGLSVAADVAKTEATSAIVVGACNHRGSCSQTAAFPARIT